MVFCFLTLTLRDQPIQKLCGILFPDLIKEHLGSLLLESFLIQDLWFYRTLQLCLELLSPQDVKFQSIWIISQCFFLTLNISQLSKLKQIKNNYNLLPLSPSCPAFLLIKLQLNSSKKLQAYLKDYNFLVAQMVKNLPAMQRPGFDPWIRKIPWRREWLPTPVFLPGESHGQRSLVGTVHGVTKSQTRLNDLHFPFYTPNKFLQKLQD